MFFKTNKFKIGDLIYSNPIGKKCFYLVLNSSIYYCDIYSISNKTIFVRQDMTSVCNFKKLC